MNANVKNKKDAWFPAIFLRFAQDKLRERLLFRVNSRLSRRSVGAKGDVSRAISLGLAIWAGTVSLGLAGTFPSRPTAAEMDEVVRLGAECARGVNERCWATQYQTNPVQYRVAPFTNNARWYLDQNLMGSMATKARALVPYYANPATIYHGTPNITMLTVTGVWAQLVIGDGTTNFTATPAVGTNAATYGDSPWRIYQTNLVERFKVLNALNSTRRIGFDIHSIKSEYSTPGGGVWEIAAVLMQNEWLTRNSDTGQDWWGCSFHAGGGPIGGYSGNLDKTVTGGVTLAFSDEQTMSNLSVVRFFMYATNDYTFTPNSIFDNNGLTGLVNGAWGQVGYFEGLFTNGQRLLFLDDAIPPNIPANPTLQGDGLSTRGYHSGWGIYGKQQLFFNWQFNYCTNKYWE